jgi:5-methylcytosine-specific restriction endonuclease McrBC regulatory subunit McrC
MNFSQEDITILELERDIRHYQKLTTACNNAEPQCTKFHNKAMSLLREQQKLIYDNNGMYRKDKRHLLDYLEGDINKAFM